jgi:hypothetical protein
MKKSNKTQKRQKLTKAKSKRVAQFDAVARINTAPVAIGNSIRGSKPVVTNSSDGCRVVGRDFAFEAKATVAAANSWSLIGGMPITPAVLVTSSLRAYTQIYSNFKINRLAFHYITSSPTSQAGDILFYYERERNSPMIDFTNNSFLPFVLSDPYTILGPQWMNHTMTVKPVSEFKNTNYGLNSDLNEESAGSVFLFSKTSSANSPGYILVDFDITFKEMCVNPRAGILPISRGLWNYLTLTVTATLVNNGTSQFALAASGNNPDGAATANPTGLTSGDIYKAIFLVTNSTVSGTNAAWTNVTTANMVAYEVGGGQDVAVTVDDGFTLYLLWDGQYYRGFQSLEAAKAANTASTATTLMWGVNATVTASVCCMVSYVGSAATGLQSSY